MTEKQQWLDEINWEETELIPAIAQDYQTGRILMVAWVNKEALRLSVEENRAVYWSRSRQRLWRKGEESGHIQHLHEVQLDCDEDVIIFKVQQQGGMACHTGRKSCFFRSLKDGQWQIIEPVIKDPGDIYS